MTSLPVKFNNNWRQVIVVICHGTIKTSGGITVSIKSYFFQKVAVVSDDFCPPPEKSYLPPIQNSLGTKICWQTNDLRDNNNK